MFNHACLATDYIQDLAADGKTLVLTAQLLYPCLSFMSVEKSRE